MSVDAGTLARLNILIGLDDKAAAEGMRGLEKRTRTLQQNLGRIAGTMMKTATLPLIALGAALIKSADTLQKGVAALRLQTGATGAALDALSESYRRVLRTATQGAEEVGNVMGFLQTRTELVGEPLEKLTTQVLQLSRIGKTDLMTVANTATRTFGDWSIATDKQAGALDWLWKVSQGSGIGIDRLMGLVVQFGAPMRQLGFSFEQATAMLGKFEAEGVNTEVVMSSLRISLGRMAQEGVRDPVTELKKIIHYIKEAGSVGEANTIAMKVFGTKAGVDMAAAIREGRLDLDAFLAKIKGSEETIDKAADAAELLGDKLKRLRNNIILAAEPLGRELIVRVEALIPLIEENVVKLGDWIAKWDELPASAKKIALWSAGFLIAAGPVLAMLLKLSNLVTFLITNWPIMLAVMGGLALGTAIKKVQEWLDAERLKANKEYWRLYFEAHPEQRDIMGPAGLDLDWRPPAEPWSPPDDAGSLDLATASAAGISAPRAVQVEHSGTIRVEGVDDKGQLVAFVDFLAEDMRADADRYANLPSERRQFK